jgi:hypothetical protein
MVVDVLGTESVDSDLGWMDGLDSPGALHCRKMLIGKTAREQRSNVGCQQGVRWEGCGKGCGKGARTHSFFEKHLVEHVLGQKQAAPAASEEGVQAAHLADAGEPAAAHHGRARVCVCVVGS